MRDGLAGGAISIVVALLVGGCASAAPAEVLDQRVRFDSVVELPAPILDGDVSFEAAVERRRSAREFASESIPPDVVGQLLWAGQGITDSAGRRAAPSAGARYPIELYAVTDQTVGHYLPDQHRVEQRSDDRVLGRLGELAFGQEWIADAPFVIVIAAVPERTAVEYGAVADSLVDRESGHVAQNILLQATALGLASVPVGGFDPTAVARLLALPPGHDVRYLVPVG